MARTRRAVQVTSTVDVMHTFDIDAAQSALNDVLAFDPGALDSRPWSEQVAAVRSLYASLGAVYRNANVPPQTDPVYVDTFSKWYAPHYALEVGASAALAIDPSDPAWSRVNGIGPSMASSDPGGELRTRIDRAFAALGREPITAHILIRLELDERGRIVEACLNGRDGPGNDGVCDFGRGTLYIGCAQDGSRAEGCDRYDWRTLAWSDDPWPSGFRKVLCPLRWFAEFAVEVAQRIRDRADPWVHDPISAMVGSSARYVAMWNAAIVDAFHLPTASGMESVIASNRAAIQTAIRAQADTVASQASTAATLFAAMAVAAAGVSSTGPVGVIVGAVIAVLAVIMRLLPYAVGTEVDRFGRTMPLLMVATIPDAPASDAERSVIMRDTASSGTELADYSGRVPSSTSRGTTYTILPTTGEAPTQTTGEAPSQTTTETQADGGSMAVPVIAAAAILGGVALFASKGRF